MCDDNSMKVGDAGPTRELNADDSEAAILVWRNVVPMPNAGLPKSIPPRWGT